jgi:hypothetical protein
LEIYIWVKAGTMRARQTGREGSGYIGWLGGLLDRQADLDLGIGWQDEGYVDWPNRFWIGWLGA